MIRLTRFLPGAVALMSGLLIAAAALGQDAKYRISDDSSAAPQELEQAPTLSNAVAWPQFASGNQGSEHLRAGCPQSLRWLTIPSNTRFYGGYYVGGSVPILGEGRCQDEGGTPYEGTWGWDYSGIAFPKRVALHWNHGRRYQGGTGAYKTDGPKLRDVLRH